MKPLPYRAPKDDSPAASDDERFKNLTLPLWLLGGGIAVHLGAAFFADYDGIAVGMMAIALQLAIGKGMMLAAMLLAAKFRGISFGPFWIGVFKLSALSIAPSAILAIFTPFLHHVPLGGLIGWAGEFVAFFTLLGLLFDLEQGDTWYCIAVIFIVQVAKIFILLWALSKWRS